MIKIILITYYFVFTMMTVFTILLVILLETNIQFKVQFKDLTRLIRLTKLGYLAKLLDDCGLFCSQLNKYIYIS